MSTSATHLAHHFDDARQQFRAAQLGMWVFLATEVLFFGGLFAGYMQYRITYPAAFEEGSRHLDLVLGTINTAVLLTSSLTMVLAAHASQAGHRRRIVWLLAGTMLLGSVFLGIKGYEYYHKISEGLFPTRSAAVTSFEPATTGPEHTELFYSFYFAMTGLHAAHMVIGIGLLTVLLVMAKQGRFSSGYHTPLEMTGLYWHFVDIIWVFLFPLLYLLH